MKTVPTPRTAPKRRKIWLSPEAEAALADALDTIGQVADVPNRSWLAHLAVDKVCQEIVNVGSKGLVWPLAVSLRTETLEETLARIVLVELQTKAEEEEHTK